MTGRTVGLGELEYRLNGVIDSIAFGQAGTALEGLLLDPGRYFAGQIDAAAAWVQAQQAACRLAIPSVVPAPRASADRALGKKVAKGVKLTSPKRTPV